MRNNKPLPKKTIPPFVFKATHYPTQPGCYLMRDRRGRVIYVGKAKNLRTRLSSYFQPSQKRWKARRIITFVADIEVILVNNEYESLVLENNLIKLYKPRFNRVLKADTSGYYYLQMTGEVYPRLVRYRKNRYVKAVQGLKEVNAGHRFGPYLTANHREILLAYVNDNFRLRTCKPLGRRVCLRYHLGHCSGLCEGKVSADAYNEQVRQAIMFLSHPQEVVIEKMRENMLHYAAQLAYEKAQKVKEQINALTYGLQSQTVETDVDYNQDVLFFGSHHVLVAEVRQGALQRMNLHKLPAANETSTQQFILTRYAVNCPDELICNTLANSEQVQSALTALHQRSIKLTLPQQGSGYYLIKLCEMNYHYRKQNSTGKSEED